LRQKFPRLRRYARALVGDSSEADDLIQDTLERALARLEQWRDGAQSTQVVVFYTA
jgi:RNA polymerase sigma-70 factor (ECF subfamily)